MIKAILFDWGGVMSNGGRGGEAALRLAENLRITEEEASRLIESVWGYYSRGFINETELWAAIEKLYGTSISHEQRKIWNSWSVMATIPEMKDFVKRLREDGYKIGLVSNVIPDTAAEIRTHGGYDIFDFTILSYEVGVAKPDRAIYELALERLDGIRADECIFVDDQERCLVPAQAMGMRTVLARNVPQTVDDVHKILAETNR